MRCIIQGVQDAGCERVRTGGRRVLNTSSKNHRNTRLERQGSSSGSGSREMEKVIIEDIQYETEVPFSSVVEQHPWPT